MTRRTHQRRVIAFVFVLDIHIHAGQGRQPHCLQVVIESIIEEGVLAIQQRTYLGRRQTGSLGNNGLELFKRGLVWRNGTLVSITCYQGYKQDETRGRVFHAHISLCEIDVGPLGGRAVVNTHAD